ncbi:23S rRNA (adenine(2030)-N(6))-methyltransferase RlmJ [Halomonas sp. I5-271120]|uniref:23S rRNA (adenine(2030)-N(6))-methyltransferase RlmJ n=1 Tax=Halomonas sp. I5-271120 TaxID=3061632 RepID=UPI00271488BD|nr:23S rRNA (adenine(2030)-N(6))-methyltransferase RlmJ [Halomonas sp. I5-271120]
MLAYQHAYHAGNFADVHKHLTLFAVTRHLLRKKSPITYVDTHAGRGSYPLDAEETRKLEEYRQGVAPLWEGREALRKSDALLGEWLDALVLAQREARPEGEPRLAVYPGSPWWLTHVLRPQDRLSLYELHPKEHDHLSGQALPSNAWRIHGDGLEGLKKRLPVATPRLCVLIDPSYERKEEYAEVAATLSEIGRKARHAVVMIWYPLLPAGRHHVLLDEVKRAGLRKLWRSEFILQDPGTASHGMYGSGMLVMNPPWGLDEILNQTMSLNRARLAPQGRHESGWWVGE